MHFYKTNVALFFAALLANGMANPVSVSKPARDGGSLLNLPIISNNQCSNGDTYCCDSSSSSKTCTQTTAECESSQTLVCCSGGLVS
jgi:hypothetical protein